LPREGTYKLTYDGGSIPNLKTGTGTKLYLDQNQIRIIKENADVMRVPASAVTEISYGQDVHRRVGAAIGLAVVSLGIGALMALTSPRSISSASRGTTGATRAGQRSKLIRTIYRGVLAGLEGITGMKAVNSDTMTWKTNCPRR
jgi:CxxC motif-containing protein (DUF1111 family)